MQLSAGKIVPASGRFSYETCFDSTPLRMGYIIDCVKSITRIVLSRGSREYDAGVYI